jgi:hypothetical protein
MHLRPVHPEAAATLLTDTAETGPSTGHQAGPAVRSLAGPEERDAVDMARAVAAARHPGVHVVRLPVPSALRRGLLPRGDVDVDGRRFEDWLREPPPS